MKILYLYSDLMGYQIPIFKQYIEKYNAEVHVIYWDHKKLTPYKPPLFDNITYYKRSSFQNKQMIDFASNLNPTIVYISGWMDKGYLSVVKALRKRGVPVVSGFDDIWYGTLRQRVASWLFPILKNRYFSHAWVAGPYQYEFAKNLGFKNNQIIFNCLSADLKIFNDSYHKSIKFKSALYPHRFLYVGRFEYVKGVDIFVQAWNNLKFNGLTKDWDISVIGNGILYNDLLKIPGIEVINFLQPEDIVNEIERYGCFVLPSRKEQWSLVLHEFAAAGLPIICSDICGAAPMFVIEKYNGFIFKGENIKSLENKMLEIINSSDEILIKMAENSHTMGQRINPQMSAASFLSLLN